MHESLPVAQNPCRWQEPRPQDVANASTMPSQSLSVLSQTSGNGGPGAHESVPAVQASAD